jgi:hypothetical protein
LTYVQKNPIFRIDVNQKQKKEKKMKNLLTLMLVFTLTGALMAGWDHDETILDWRADTTDFTFVGELTGNKYMCNSPHGVAVDANGKIWVAFYFSFGTDDDGVFEFVDAKGDTSRYAPIYIFNEDGSIFKTITHITSPDGDLDTLDSANPTTGSGRGISVDGNGNIVYTAFATSYRFDPETFECTGKYVNALVGTGTETVHEPESNLYFTSYVLAGDKPIHMLDSDFAYLGNAVDTLGNITRTLAARAADGGGVDLYNGTTWNGNGVFHWYSAEPEFEMFEKVDSLGNCYPSAADCQEDSKLWPESIDWDLNGNMIVGSLRASWGGPKGSVWHILDVDNNAYIASFGTAVDDSCAANYDMGYTNPGGANGPRGAYQVDDNTLYTVDFYLFTLDKWTYSASSVEDVNVPASFTLNQNYPNPFNAATTIEYTIENNANVIVSVYNMKGQHIETLHNGPQTAGVHTISWDAKNVASGTYLYKVQVGNEFQTKKMVLMK